MKRLFPIIAIIFVLLFLICSVITNPKKAAFVDYVIFNINKSRQISDVETQCLRDWANRSCLRNNYIVFSTINMSIRGKSYKSYCFLSNYKLAPEIDFSKISCPLDDHVRIEAQAEFAWDMVVTNINRRNQSFTELLNSGVFPESEIKSIINIVNTFNKPIPSKSEIYDSLKFTEFSAGNYRFNRLIDSLTKALEGNRSTDRKAKLADIFAQLEATRNRINTESQRYNSTVEDQERLFLYSVLPYKRIYKIEN